jgi:hypothetical protein
MTVTSKPLVTAKYATNAETTEYTASGLRAIIDKFTGYNGTAGAVTLTVKLVPNGGSAGASNIIVTRAIAAGATDTFPEVVGHTLEPGGVLSVLAGASTSIVIRCTGREVTGS